MRSRVEPGSFKLLTDLGKCGFRLIRQREIAAGDESIDVVHPKADAFHVKRANRQPERFAFFEDRISRLALRLGLHAGDQTLQTVLSGFAVIGIGSHFSCM
jgi:hypothetical protein